MNERIYIYHDKKPTFGLALNEVTWPNDFDFVAIVNSSSLEAAFELTNHIDGDWLKNKKVNALVKQARSTSVGDVMVLGDSVYICLPVGWKEIGKADDRIVINKDTYC